MLKMFKIYIYIHKETRRRRHKETRRLVTKRHVVVRHKETRRSASTAQSPCSKPA